MSALRRLCVRKLVRDGARWFSITEGRIISGKPFIEIPEATIQNVVFEEFSKWDNDRIAMECAVTGNKYTFRQLTDKTKNLSKSLRKKLKLKQGDVVALLLPNVPQFPLAALGILSAGLVITTINPIYTTSEVSKQLTDSAAKAIITLVDLYPLVLGSLKQAQIQIPVLAIKSQATQSLPEGVIDFNEFTDNDVDFPEIQNISANDLAILPYSSGTTGLPKGVRLTHANIVANLYQMKHPDVVKTERATSTHQSVTPAILPFFHIYGFTIICLHQTMLGAKSITLPRFTPELYVNVLEKHKPHVLYLAPPIAIFLGNHPGVTKRHFERIETIVSGAAPLGGSDEEKLLKKADKPLGVFQGYGLTETSPVVLTTRRSVKKTEPCPGSVGNPVPNTDVKIITVDDDSGRLLGPNEKGELLVRGPQVTEGYHNRPEETEGAYLDGWFKTGDIAYYDENGNFYITDRLKELIKVKGFQVAPAELEEIIRSHPQVSDAAVIGVPHAKNGEAPKAFVVPKAGLEFDVNELKEFVSKKVASYKQLNGGVEIIDSIPKNATGKILRRELKGR